MLVFIAYPREFEELAIKLEVDLNDRNFETFLDREDIKPSELWKLKIEANIKKASVFIILYDPKAANPSRYFFVELGRIKEECKRNAKKIITVIFSPTKPKDLPPHLNNHQLIEATTNGLTDTGNDDYWINNVVHEIERLKSSQKEGIKQWRKVIFPVTAIITLAGMVMTALLYQKLNDRSVVYTATPSESTCKSLLGNYHFPLGYEYVYIDKQEKGIRATSYDGSWNAPEEDNCKRGEQEGTFIFKGDDTTVHKIEIKLNNKYEHIANATNKHASEITIGKDGRLGKRELFFPVDGKPEIERIGLDRKIWRTHEEYFKAKLDEYETVLRTKYREAHKRKRCTATLGKDENNRDVIASICPGDPGYIRVMEKKQ